MIKFISILFLIFFVNIFSVTNIFSAVPIVFYNTNNFPEIDVKFMLVDNTNNVIPSLTQQSAGITFLDNNIPLPLTSFSSSKIATEKASIVIAFDLSISQRTNNVSDFNFATDITNKYISYLSSEQTEAAMISILDIPSIEADFTSSMNSLATSINNFTIKTFGNLYRGITLENTGGLSVLENSNTTNKSILLVTQGIISSDESELIISKSKQSGVRINILYISNIVPKNIQRLADETGGFCINKQMMDKIGLPIFATMAKLSEGWLPYSFKATSYLNCDGEHIFKLNTNDYGFSEIVTEMDDIKLTNIATNPVSLEFPFVKPSNKETKKVKLYAKTSDVIIDTIYLDNLLFSITGEIPTFPYYLNKDDSLELQITFSPVDSCISFARLLAISDACSYDTLFLTGGYPNVPPAVPSIRIINPECNDVLVIGDTIEIEWNGVLPEDIVSIFSENLTGVTDTIAKNIVGLKQQFVIKDNGKEENIKFIINQMWPNNIGKTLNFKHNASVLTAFWNNYQDRIVTTDKNNYVTIWNANNGDKLYTFPQFSKSVRWATYAPNPKSVNDNYIGVACHDSCAYIYDANDFSIYWKYKTNTSTVWSIEFSADCKYAVISLGNGNFEILDIARKEVILRKKLNADNCRFAIFHPTKQYEIMAISSYTGIIKFYDLEGELLDTIDTKYGKPVINSEYVTYNYDGTKILQTNYQNATVDIIDRNTGDLMYSLSHSDNDKTNLINHASFFHKTNEYGIDEDYILTSGKDGTLQRWNVIDGSKTLEDNLFSEHKLAANTGILSKDGWRMLSSSDDSTAKIWNLNQKTLQSDTTCDLRIMYAKGSFNDTLNLGNVFQNEIILKTFDSAFHNICDFNYNIRAIRIVGEHITDFNIIDEFDFPLNINGHGNINFNIAFKPTALGLRTAKIQIILPNDTIYITLIGNGLNIGLQPLCELINFENVFIDDYKDTLLPVAVNVSNRTINIENINLTGPQKSNYKFIENNVKQSVSPNDTLFAKIRFFPLTIGKKNAVINIEHSFHSYPLNFNITGKGISIVNDTIHLNINDLSAEVGQTINCPIILNTLTNNNISNINEITFSLIFNSSLIYPQTNSNEVKILNSAFFDNENKIIDVSILYKQGKQQIDGLQFVTLLGNDTTTNIQIINSKSYSNFRYYIKSNSATFTLIDNCKAGGTRLFDEKGKLVLNQNVPNPVSDETKIDFELRQNGLTTLDIYDIAGKHILNIFKEDKLKGTYSVIINIKKLDAGLYYYVLNNANQKEIKTMLVK